MVPPSSAQDARLDDLERRLKAAILDWDDALERLQRLAGRASKLKGLDEQAHPMSHAEQINAQILARRTAGRTNGAS